MPIIAIILILTTIEQVAVDIYLPSLPMMAQYFSVDNSYLQSTLSLYLLGFSISPLFFGPLCDRFGRRIIILWGLFIYSLACLICTTTSSIQLLLAMRFIQGLGSGALAVSVQAIVRDSFCGTKLARATSYMSITWSLVPIIAPAIGAYVQYYLSWQANFGLMFIYAAITFFLMFRYLPETMKSTPAQLQFGHIINRYKTFLINKSFMLYCGCTTLTFGVIIAFNTAAPFLFQRHLGLTVVEFGWLALAVGGCYLLGTLLNSFMLFFYRVERLLKIGQLGMFVSAILMVTLSHYGYFSVISVSVPAGVIIFFGGLVYPNAAALAFEPITKNTGIASALYGSIQLLGCAIISALIAQFPETTSLPVSLTILVLCSFLTLIISTNSSYLKPVKEDTHKI